MLLADIQAYKVAKAQWSVARDEWQKRLDYYNELLNRLKQPVQTSEVTPAVEGVAPQATNKMQPVQETVAENQGGENNEMVEPVGNSEQLTNDVKTEDVNESENNEMVAEGGNAPGNEGVLLSDEVDENGRQFVLNSNGNIVFGEIGEDSGLTAAPILLSEGLITNPATNDGYGLVHIEARHGDQIRNAGYKSVVEFVEEVAKNYEVIREGKDRNGQQTYMFQLTDKHNNTLMVELSGDGIYWNINTAGIFKTSYGKNRKEVYNRHTTAKQPTETVEASQDAEQSGTQATSSMNAPTTSSVSEDRNYVSNAQENTQKSDENAENGGEITETTANPTDSEPDSATSANEDELDIYLAELKAQQERQMADVWAEGMGFDSYENYLDYTESLLEDIEEQRKGFDETEYYNNLAGNYGYDTTGERKDFGRGGELLQGEQFVTTTPSEVVGEGYEGTAVPSDVRGGGDNALTQGETRQVNTVNDESVAEGGNAPGQSGVIDHYTLNGVGNSTQMQKDMEALRKNNRDEYSKIQPAYELLKQAKERGLYPNELEELRTIVKGTSLESKIDGWFTPVMAEGENAPGQSGVATSESTIYTFDQLNDVKAQLGKLDATTAPFFAKRLFSIRAWDTLEEANNALKELLASYGNTLQGESAAILPFLDEAQKLIADYKAAVKKPTFTEEVLENGDKLITNYNSRGEVEAVALEHDGRIVAVDSYDEGVLFEHTEYDENGVSTSVTRYDKQGNPVVSGKTEQPETNEVANAGPVNMDTFQLNMSDEDFNALLNGGNKTAIGEYLAEMDGLLRIGVGSPLDGQEALREEYRKAVEQYGKENVPAEVMDDLNSRMQPYSDLSRAIFDRKYALQDKLREIEASEAQANELAEKEAKAEHKQTAFGGFLAGKTDLGASAAEKALSKKYNFDGKVMTVAEFVEDAIDNGNVKLSAIEEPKYKGASRAAWNRMDAKQQEADAKRVKESGTKTVYTVNDHDLGKTAYDYAKFLLDKNAEQEKADATWMDEAFGNLFEVMQEKVDEDENAVLYRTAEDIETAPETASVQDEHQPTVVSSADGAKVLKDLDNAIKEYENKSSYPKTLLGDVAKVLNAKKHGSNSQYATFEAVNGKVFTIRLANHNAKISTFDNHDESEGISIVVTAQDNNGITNDGEAHVVEFFYDAIKLRKADGKPLVEILKSIKQALYSGEYKDNTGLATREEVNEDVLYRIFGGNSGYVGYSMSKRAAEAREEGRFPKTDFKKEYGVTDKELKALVDAGIVSDKEWHHTSMYGNKTTFYGFENKGASDFFNENRERVKEAIKNGTLDEFVPEFQQAAEAFEDAEFENFRKGQEKRRLRDEYNEFINKNSVVPAEYVASNGVVVNTNGRNSDVYWIASKDGERLTKRRGKEERDAAFAELREKLNKERVKLPTFEQWKSENLTREGEGSIADREVVMDSDPYSKALGRPRYTGKKMGEYVARQRMEMAKRVKALAQKLNLNIDVLESTEGLSGKRAKAKGWYEPKGKRIVVVIPNHSSVNDAVATVLHEAVAHHGLRELFGENFDTFLQNVYNNADADVREAIETLAAQRYNGNLLTATEEYLASLAENTDFEYAAKSGWWERIKDYFFKMLRGLGIEGFDGIALTDNELRYILWRSYQNLANPGMYNNVFAQAKDTALQYELKVGNYAADALNGSMVAGEDITPEMKEGGVIKPKSNRNIENKDVTLHKTKDGRIVRYEQLDLFNNDERAVTDIQRNPSEGNGNANTGAGSGDIQRDNLAGGNSIAQINVPLRPLEKGEMSLVQRIFTKSRAFDFTAGEQIESLEDVAYIFKNLEDEIEEGKVLFYNEVKNSEETLNDVENELSLEQTNEKKDEETRVLSPRLAVDRAHKGYDRSRRGTGVDGRVADIVRIFNEGRVILADTPLLRDVLKLLRRLTIYEIDNYLLSQYKKDIATSC